MSPMKVVIQFTDSNSNSNSNLQAWMDGVVCVLLLRGA